MSSLPLASGHHPAPRFLSAHNSLWNRWTSCSFEALFPQRQCAIARLARGGSRRRFKGGLRLIDHGETEASSLTVFKLALNFLQDPKRSLVPSF